MSEGNQLNLSNEGIMKEPNADQIRSSPARQRSSRKAERKHSSHRSERTIDDKKKRSSRSRSSHRSSHRSSPRTPKKMERTVKQEDSCEGSADLSPPVRMKMSSTNVDSPLSSDSDEREYRDERIHSKHKHSLRNRLSSRESSGDGRSSHQHNSTENRSRSPHRHSHRNKSRSPHRHSRKHRSSSLDRHSQNKLQRTSKNSSSCDAIHSMMKDEASKRSKRRSKRGSPRTSHSPHRRHISERFDLIPSRPSRTKSMGVGGGERTTKRKNRSSHQQPQRTNSLDTALDVSNREVKQQQERETSSSRKSAPVRERSLDIESLNGSSHRHSQKLRSSSFDRHSQNKLQRTSKNSSSCDAIRSMMKDEASKRSKRRSKRGSQRTSHSPHRRHINERLDLIPSRPSRTKSMEVGGRERTTKRKNRSSRQPPQRTNSLDTSLDVSNREIKQQQERETSSSRKSAPARERSLDIESLNGSSHRRMKAVARGSTRHNHGSDDQSLRESKRKASLMRFSEASSPPGAFPRSSNHGSGDQSLRESKRKASLMRFSEASSPPGAFSRSSNHGSDDQSLRESKRKASLMRFSEASSPPGAISRSSNHSSGGKSHRDSKRKSRGPLRLAEASSPPSAASYSLHTTKRRAANPYSNGATHPDHNNGNRRSPSPEESIDARPGAHAVSLDGEEFRGSEDMKRRAFRSVAIDMSGRRQRESEHFEDTTGLQAVVVDEENPEVEAIKAENERLRQSMIAENQRRRQEMENRQNDNLGHLRQMEDLSTVGEITIATPAAEENDDTVEEEKKKRRRKLVTFLCLLLTLVAGAVGAVFASKLTADDASLNSLSGPTASSPPSSPPTITMLYDPPSDEDCQAVANGEAITDQDAMITITLDVGLEIVLNRDIAQNEWMDQLLQSILVHLIPYLVGCTDDRKPSVGNRYVFGNGNATIDYDDAETCEKETDLPCYPVAVYLDLTVKDDENISSLISLLETLIGSDGSEDSMTDRLQLSDDFNEVVLEDITNMPSLYPPSWMPSESPTGQDPTYPILLYQPPTEENCRAIATNVTIAGREDMQDADFGLGLDVVLSGKSTMTPSLVDELLNAIQEKILPSLAGCNINLDEFVEDWRFVIFDAFVSGNVRPDERCIDDNLATQNCHFMSVKLDLFLKGRVRFLDIIDLISDEDVNISNHLGLSDPFSIVKLVQIDNLTPTASPTTMPSDAPSWTPSENPTGLGANNPTLIPTATPTRRVYGFPTQSPSFVSTLAPSVVAATALPVANPSPATTDVPTASPSTLPIETPSAVPSFRPSKTPNTAPTVAPLTRPTLRPTNTPNVTPTTISPLALPTLRPSDAPSKRPSTVPSGSPSTTPSAAPTPPAPSTAPSSRPSSPPSDAPSESPSATPSVQPSDGSYYWVTCGKFGNCSGRSATVQNANYVTIGGIPSTLLEDEIAVRCCSENALDGFAPPRSETCPYADSKIGGVCYNTATYHEAENVCRSVGARLCTLSEIENNCAIDTGCSHNDRMTWTSTPGPMGATGAPIPTGAPTTPPATQCCSTNFKDCDFADPWCDVNEQQCGQCNGNYIVQGSCPVTKIAKWGDCTNNVDGCCEPLRCVGDVNYRQCLE